MDVINPIDSFNPAPFYRHISNLKGLSNLVSVDAPENQDVALGLPSDPEAPHCTTPGGIMFRKRCQWCLPLPGCVMGEGRWECTKAPFTASLCGQNGADIQTPARSACLHFKKFDTARVLLESCFISCYLICDSKPTENSFQLRSPPRAIAS